MKLKTSFVSAILFLVGTPKEIEKNAWCAAEKFAP